MTPVQPRIAFYDFDGTLSRGNVVQRYLFFALRHGPAAEAAWRMARLAALAPRLYAAERRSRARFNRLLFGQYRGLRLERLRELQPALAARLRRGLYAAGLAQLKADRAAGLRLVLMTGELEVAIGQLAAELGFDDVLANELGLAQGLATGELSGALLAEEGKARAAADHCRRRGVEPAEAKAYADSLADAPLLELVGWPTAVNPDSRLRQLAVERGWPVVDWRA